MALAEARGARAPGRQQRVGPVAPAPAAAEPRPRGAVRTASLADGPGARAPAAASTARLDGTGRSSARASAWERRAMLLQPLPASPPRAGAPAPAALRLG